MSKHQATIRLATLPDIPATFDVRTTVVENPLNREQLAELGITEQSFAQRMTSGSCGCWCAVRDLQASGYQQLHLFTGPDTRAFGFYCSQGWIATGRCKGGDVEMSWTADAV